MSDLTLNFRSKNFKKPLDKAKAVWYNITVAERVTENFIFFYSGIAKR